MQSAGVVLPQEAADVEYSPLLSQRWLWKVRLALCSAAGAAAIGSCGTATDAWCRAGSKPGC